MIYCLAPGLIHQIINQMLLTTLLFFFLLATTITAVLPLAEQVDSIISANKNSKKKWSLCVGCSGDALEVEERKSYGKLYLTKKIFWVNVLKEEDMDVSGMPLKQQGRINSGSSVSSTGSSVRSVKSNLSSTTTICSNSTCRVDNERSFLERTISLQSFVKPKSDEEENTVIFDYESYDEWAIFIAICTYRDIEFLIVSVKGIAFYPNTPIFKYLLPRLSSKGMLIHHSMLFTLCGPISNFQTFPKIVNTDIFPRFVYPSYLSAIKIFKEHTLQDFFRICEKYHITDGFSIQDDTIFNEIKRQVLMDISKEESFMADLIAKNYLNHVKYVNQRILVRRKYPKDQVKKIPKDKRKMPLDPSKDEFIYPIKKENIFEYSSLSFFDVQIVTEYLRWLDSLNLRYKLYSSETTAELFKKYNGPKVAAYIPAAEKKPITIIFPYQEIE